MRFIIRLLLCSILLSMQALSSQPAIARNEEEITKLIEQLGSDDTTTIGRAAKALLQYEDAAQHKRIIIRTALQALQKINNQHQDIFTEKKHAPENQVIQLLLKIAPRNPGVVRKLLHLISKPLKTRAGSTMNLVFLPFIDALDSGSPSWPLKRYLLDAAKHKPQAFTVPLLARRHTHHKIAAAACLAMAGQLTERMYMSGIHLIIVHWQFVDLGLLNQIRSLARVTVKSAGENKTSPVVAVEKLMRRDVEDVLKKSSKNGQISLTEEMLDGLGLYAWTYAELQIQGAQQLFENILNRLFEHLADHVRDDLRRVIHFTKTGERLFARTIDPQSMILGLYSQETRADFRHMLMTSPFQLTMLAEGLLASEVEERQDYLGDIVRDGGYELANLVIAKLIEIGGPDMHEELRWLPICGPYFEGKLDL